MAGVSMAGEQQVFWSSFLIDEILKNSRQQQQQQQSEQQVNLKQERQLQLFGDARAIAPLTTG